MNRSTIPGHMYIHTSLNLINIYQNMIYVVRNVENTLRCMAKW